MMPQIRLIKGDARTWVHELLLRKWGMQNYHVGPRFTLLFIVVKKIPIKSEI